MTTEYDIVAHTSINDFRELVQSRLNDGWDIEGNVVVTYEMTSNGGYGMQYTQAFTRISEDGVHTSPLPEPDDTGSY